MSEKNYGEPWCVDDDFDEHDIIVDVTDGYGVDRAQEVFRDDAARIVQCVNACAGIEDPQGAIELAREAMRQASWSCAQADLSNTHGVLEAALSALTPKEEKP